MKAHEIRKKFGKNSLIKKLRTARQLEVDDYFVGKKYFNGQNYGWKTDRRNT